MAFTREFLRKIAKDSGIESFPKELEDALVSEHISARDVYTESKVKPLQEKIDSFKPIEVKESEEYKKLENDFNTYKNDIQNKELNSKKLDKLKTSLKEAGANESFIERMVKGYDASNLDFEKEESVKETIESFKSGEWGDVFGEVKKQTPNTHNNNNVSNHNDVVYTKEQIEKMTPDEINSNWDKIAPQLDKIK